jgi:hypothetical protein
LYWSMAARLGLSVARFTQGAASGFKRVLEVVEVFEGVMRARGREEDGWSKMRRT